MLIYVRGEVFDASKEDIGILLHDRDRDTINNMNKDCDCYMAGPRLTDVMADRISKKLKIRKKRGVSTKFYSTHPKSVFQTSVVLAPIGINGDESHVFKLESVGFFTIKDLLDSMSGCLASVRDQFSGFGIILDNHEIAELEGYMQEFLNEYSVFR